MRRGMEGNEKDKRRGVDGQNKILSRLKDTCLSRRKKLYRMNHNFLIPKFFECQQNKKLTIS